MPRPPEDEASSPRVAPRDELYARNPLRAAGTRDSTATGWHRAGDVLAAVFGAMPCGLCTWPNGLRRDVDGSLDCVNCLREWPSERAYLEALRYQARQSWASLPEFEALILREPSSEAAVRRCVLPLLELGVAPEIVLEIALGVNARRARPSAEPDVERVLLEAARILARRAA